MITEKQTKELKMAALILAVLAEGDNEVLKDLVRCVKQGPSEELEAKFTDSGATIEEVKAAILSVLEPLVADQGKETT